MLKRVNKGLKELARLADIKVHLTTYVARHTYATVLKKSGVPIPVISEAMGHENAEVTQTYLKSFEDEVIDEANEFLLWTISYPYFLYHIIYNLIARDKV